MLGGVGRASGNGGPYPIYLAFAATFLSIGNSISLGEMVPAGKELNEIVPNAVPIASGGTRTENVNAVRQQNPSNLKFFRD
jgi:hypothetical protein